jgi:cell division protein FtsI/penicillin-binding protein 2/cell division protein FtsW (lipid II flippase)
MLALAALGAFGVLNLAGLGDSQAAWHQGATVAVGLAAMVVVSRSRTRNLRALAWIIYIAAALLLVGVAGAGTYAYGARRWLALGAVVFQPSELSKLGLLMVLALLLGSDPRRRHRLLAALAIAAVPVVLTLIEPDLSTALLLGVVVASMLVLARVRFRSLLALAAGLAVLAPFALHLLRPYQLARLHAFAGSGSDASAAGWTVLQAHIAVASGGWLGTLSSLPQGLLAQYLPARETDLAFSSLVEQRGLIAGAGVLLAGAVVIWRLVSTATRTRTRMGALVAAGFATLVGAEIVINVAGNLGLIPLAGVPFPLVSSGGTAVAVHCIAAGVVMGERREEERRRLWCPPRWARPRPRLARLTAAGLALGLVGLALSTYDLNRSAGAQLRQAALVQATRTIVIPAGRGTIEDRHGAPLAYDRPVQRVLAVPSIVESARGTDARLAALLDLPLEAVDRALHAKPPYGGLDVVVEAGAPDPVAAEVAAARLPGVIVAPTVSRAYPYGPLLAPLLRFVGVEAAEDVKLWGRLPPDEVVGRDGLERQYDTVLRGTDGVLRLLVDPGGVPVSSGTYSPPLTGGDLRLSIDLGLQRAAAASLTGALRGAGHGQPRGDLGSVVVMDVHSGQVLAMVSLPAIDDNVFGPPIDYGALGRELSAPGDPFYQHATQTEMPPGSTFKLVVAAADAAYKVVPPDRVVTTGGSFAYDGVTFQNWSDLPPQNLPQAVAWSNDVYFYKLALALGANRIAAAARELGVGQPTGVDLPGEWAGVMGSAESVSPWYPGTTVMEGIGQGPIAVTPLQDARWTAAVGTGSLVTPTLGLAASTPAHPDVFTPLPTRTPQPLSFAASLGPVQEGMRQGVTNGTGTLLRSLPQPAAGKTGTAQDPNAPDGGPDAWYTAYSPASRPDVVVTVNVRGGGEGYWTAEPVARDVLAYFDAHQAAILAGAPLQPAALPPAAGPVVARSALPGFAAAALLSGLRMPRLYPAGSGWPPLLRRRRSVVGRRAAPKSRTPPRGGARNPPGVSRRRRPEHRPA